MKVLFVSNVLESVATFRLPLIRSLKERGYGISCIAGRSSLSFADPFEVLKSESVDVHLIDLSPAGLSPLAVLRESLALWREVRQIDPDIVFTHTVKPNTLGILACRLASGGRRRLYATVNGLGLVFLEEGIRAALRRFLVSTLYRLSLGMADRVFFFNDDDLRFFVSQGIVSRERAGRLPGSGVDTERFPLLPSQAGSPCFLFVGRLIREKGIYEFVEAAAVVSRRHPEVRFVVAGGRYPAPTSVSEDELILWRRSGIVHFAGPVSDIRPMLEQSSCVVLPSYREGLTQSLLEAMSSGRAIITTRVPGCEELVVEGENGFLCDARSVSSLVEAMCRFIEIGARSRTMGQRARELVEQRYSSRAMLAALHEQVAL